MNIFVLDNDPIKAAQMLCDKHIPKMIVESAQMLSTAHRMLDGTPIKRPSKSGKTIQTYYTLGEDKDDLYYLAVHKNHPCTVWTMESIQNYQWHHKHWEAMAYEYEFRRGRVHKTYELLKTILWIPPHNISDKGLTEFPQAMNHYPQCKVPGNAVQAYRNYYHEAKPFAKWEWGRQAPEWWKGYKHAI